MESARRLVTLTTTVRSNPDEAGEIARIYHIMSSAARKKRHGGMVATIVYATAYPQDSTETREELTRTVKVSLRFRCSIFQRIYSH